MKSNERNSKKSLEKQLTICIYGVNFFLQMGEVDGYRREKMYFYTFGVLSLS